VSRTTAPSRSLPCTNHRSAATQHRAAAASITQLPSDTALVSRADYVLSIVPPRDARATAARIVAALGAADRTAKQSPLYFVELNAVAPSSARAMAAAFAPLGDAVRVVDGGIIGGPPAAGGAGEAWARPSVVLSGRYALAAAPRDGARLAAVLNARHVGDDVGVASGVKCCFAALSKGFTALAVQAFATAEALGVREELEFQVGGRQSGQLERAQRSIVGMAPKAGRWVEEMREIGRAFAEEGGWDRENVFERIAEVYTAVSEDTVLGQEKVEARTRGTTYGDAVSAIREGLDSRRKT